MKRFTKALDAALIMLAVIASGIWVRSAESAPVTNSLNCAARGGHCSTSLCSGDTGSTYASTCVGGSYNLYCCS